MRSIERRFKQFALKNPLLGTYIVFAKAVKGCGFSKGMIARWFNKLVDKDDYESRDKRLLIAQLFALSDRCEDDKK